MIVPVSEPCKGWKGKLYCSRSGLERCNCACYDAKQWFPFRNVCFGTPSTKQCAIYAVVPISRSLCCWFRFYSFPYTVFSLQCSLIPFTMFWFQSLYSVLFTVFSDSDPKQFWFQSKWYSKSSTNNVGDREDRQEPPVIADFWGSTSWGWFRAAPAIPPNYLYKRSKNKLWPWPCKNCVTRVPIRPKLRVSVLARVYDWFGTSGKVVPMVPVLSW